MTRSRRALLAVAVALAAPEAAAGAQDLSQRFSIRDVADTTFTFTIGKTRWVKPKQRGIAVDAGRQDALVARFRVLEVQGGVAIGLITGATTRLSGAHTVIMERPPERWYRSRYFWAGAVVGAVGGALGGFASQ